MLREGTRIDFDHLEQEIPGIKAKTKFFNTPMIGVSSFDIRRRIRAGEPYRYLVPTGVFETIERYKLYRDIGTTDQ